MWEEFKAIDSRVIRPVDCNELFTVNCNLNVVDVFPKFSTEDFKKRIQENLPKLQVFNYALKRINGHMFWINKSFKLHLEEVEYTENEEIENFLKNEDQWIISYHPIFEEDDKDVQALYSFKICQLEGSNQTKLIFSVNHAICDGRSAFSMFNVIRRVINGETLEKDDDKLPGFGRIECYQNFDETFYDVPKVWNEINNVPLIPKIDPPFDYIVTHHIFDYSPVKEFCKSNNISIQTMLIAMLTRAVRKYKNLPNETPIWNNTPCDTRASPYATEEYKNNKFYCNVGSIFPKIIGQATLIEDLKHCAAQLKESRNSHDDVRSIIACKDAINPETLQFIPRGRYPDAHFQSVVNSTNIGRVNGNLPLFYISNDPTFGLYNFWIHSYHTETKLFVSCLRPKNLDSDLVNNINEEMNKIFIPKN